MSPGNHRFADIRFTKNTRFRKGDRPIPTALFPSMAISVSLAVEFHEGRCRLKANSLREYYHHFVNHVKKCYEKKTRHRRHNILIPAYRVTHVCPGIDILLPRCYQHTWERKLSQATANRIKLRIRRPPPIFHIFLFQEHEEKNPSKYRQNRAQARSKNVKLGTYAHIHRKKPR